MKIGTVGAVPINEFRLFFENSNSLAALLLYILMV